MKLNKESQETVFVCFNEKLYLKIIFHLFLYLVV